MQDLNELLPIGSIVILKNATKKAMIIGVKQRDINTNHVFDYLALPYPEGFMDKNNIYFINHGAIDKVFFRGYEDEERNIFIKQLVDYYAKKEN